MRLKSSANRPGDGAALHSEGSHKADHGQLIGEYLVSQGLLREADIAEILRYQAEHGGAFGEIAVQLGRIDQEKMERAAASFIGFPILPLGSNLVSPLVVAATSVSDPYVLKIRTIRAKIAGVLKEENRGHQRMIAIVGIGANEEVSIVSANLAVIYAQLGENTAVVDCGLQTPSIHSLFHLPNQNGVTQGFSGDQFSVAAQPTPLSNLWVVPAGPTSAATASYIQRQSLIDVIGGWHLAVDQVIVNLPAMSDSVAALGTMLEGFDAVVLVARRNVTPITEMRQAIDSLDLKAVPVVGSVIG